VGWLIFFGILVCIWFISWLNERVNLYKREEARKAENAAIQEALNGFDVHTKKEKIVNLLKNTLPSGYQCDRSGCNGILLKQNKSHLYICSECKNKRRSVKI
jgi:hypothetical protein